MVTDNFSVAVGAASQAIQEANNGRYYNGYDRSNDTLSHTSVFLKLGVHF